MFHAMNWQENVSRWRAFSPAKKRRLRWESIPARVARSMTFEEEPVSEQRIRDQHNRRTPRVSSKPAEAR